MTPEKNLDTAGGSGGTGRWVGGAALAAILASLCCLGPLALAAAGLSAAGFAATFEPLRPLFLVATALLLGGAFYAFYWRTPVCAIEGGGRVKRTRAALWLATGVVGLVALFPVYAGSLLRLGATSQAVAGSSARDHVRLQVDGMTCDACAVGLEASLARVPGVLAVSVRYSVGAAVVTTDPVSPPSEDLLVAVIEKAGYEGRVLRSGD